MKDDSRRVGAASGQGALKIVMFMEYMADSATLDSQSKRLPRGALAAVHMRGRSRSSRRVLENRGCLVASALVQSSQRNNSPPAIQ